MYKPWSIVGTAIGAYLGFCFGGILEVLGFLFVFGDNPPHSFVQLFTALQHSPLTWVSAALGGILGFSLVHLLHFWRKKAR